MKSPLFDAHDHLQDYPSKAESAEALRLAAEAGVELMLCNGTSPGDWEQVLDLAAEHKGVVPCFGLHPWFLRESPPGWLEGLESFLVRVPSCVGEIGLDGGKNATGLARQEGVFAVQLRLAKRLGRPACLHCVKAWGRMLEIIKEEKPGPFMLHSYGGPAEMVAEFASLGAYFSFSGAILDAKREKLRRSLSAVPAERLLFETEAPDADAPGWRAGPAGIVEVVSAAAVILGRPAEEIAALSWANGNKFVGDIRTLKNGNP
ncbi:MAG: TatD family hydrolase [Elusimicrobiota bacterium]|nr:TatD family hydrolase [Elusimicrobiota bacterium]